RFPARKPATGKPPVGTNQIRAEAPHRAADSPCECQEKAGKGERGHRREEASLVKAAGVGHPLEQLRPIPKAMQSNSGTLFQRSSTWRVRGDHLHLVTASGGTGGDPLDEGAGRIAGKT